MYMYIYTHIPKEVNKYQSSEIIHISIDTNVESFDVNRHSSSLVWRPLPILPCLRLVLSFFVGFFWGFGDL